MNKPLVFAAGIFVGAALFVSARTLIVTDVVPVDRVSADPAVLKAAQDATDREKAFRAELDAREAYVEKAENRLGLAPAATATASAPKADDKSKMMSTLISGVIKSQMDMKMAALKSRLNLTPDQEKAIQDIMDKQAQLAQSAAGKMMDGDMSQDDMKALKDQSGDALNLDKQLQGILSPDQLAEYQNMKSDDKKSQTEAATNMELSSIQGSLQLSDDQKDNVFNALLQVNQSPGSDSAAKKAALQPLLTPQQFDAYSKYLDSQDQMIKSLTQGLRGASGDSADAPAAQ